MLIWQIVMYFFFPVTLLATFILTTKLPQRPSIKFIPAIVSLLFAVFSYSMFLYNNGMGEFMIALLSGCIALANLLLVIFVKLFARFLSS
ncbi:hypothetical protein B7492_29650 (plasmid) [Bacillus mycoides]|uniref:Sugar ABC transporter ATPase n=1 Tax=Bacillus mycoides TaxID=1405 RepID=A0A1W6AIA7_BACMY|nr:hypothetical protein B7492_29650 [Bacillus mycoides]